MAEKQGKNAVKKTDQATVHPETQRGPARVPGEKSSKATAATGTDGRTGHDKDGNDAQASRVGARPARR